VIFCSIIEWGGHTSLGINGYILRFPDDQLLAAQNGAGWELANAGTALNPPVK
jgi:hypothetical protein